MPSRPHPRRPTGSKDPGRPGMTRSGRPARAPTRPGPNPHAIHPPSARGFASCGRMPEAVSARCSWRATSNSTAWSR